VKGGLHCRQCDQARLRQLGHSARWGNTTRPALGGCTSRSREGRSSPLDRKKGHCTSCLQYARGIEMSLPPSSPNAAEDAKELPLEPPLQRQPLAGEVIAVADSARRLKIGGYGASGCGRGVNHSDSLFSIHPLDAAERAPVSGCILIDGHLLEHNASDKMDMADRLNRRPSAFEPLGRPSSGLRWLARSLASAAERPTTASLCSYSRAESTSVMVVVCAMSRSCASLAESSSSYSA
jgi:hypothetical protein